MILTRLAHGHRPLDNKTSPKKDHTKMSTKPKVDVNSTEYKRGRRDGFCQTLLQKPLEHALGEYLSEKALAAAVAKLQKFSLEEIARRVHAADILKPGQAKVDFIVNGK